MKTFVGRQTDVERRWHVIDAAGRPLGRIATEVATLLRGKHKPTFSPFADVGDYVVVINADRVEVTGRKRESKFYHSHSGYPGGLHSTSLGQLLATRPERVIEKAVRGMLPKSRLGRKQFTHLRVYRGADHPHEGQVAAARKTGSPVQASGDTT